MKELTDLGQCILKMRSEGLSYAKISKELGCSKSTIAYYCGNEKENIKNRKQKEPQYILKFKKKLSNFKQRIFNTTVVNHNYN